ncbi:WEB family protein At1g75720-like isoform X2 [Prosopis cineraria]|uniref:WEB family protein At1g75720-like isoform X2 n=1 Tax=Prosopis cineraria TaxID=364024 RepID=UPI00241062C1|nr:WEB family protein At1g75720-like isoform X2 [Prosopis cineraria]
MFTKAAEIDTRAPFRSVKDAVSLFGEKVLAQELHATQLEEEELERTKQELQQLRQRENEEKHAVECEIEDVKFVENLSKSDQERVEFQKKRYVTLRILPPWLTSFTHRVLRSWRGILPSGRRRRTL